MLPADQFQLFKRLWPHFLIVSAAIGYLLLGGYLFFLIETRWGGSPKSIDRSKSMIDSELLPQGKDLMRNSRLDGWLCAGGDTISKVHEASRACRPWKEASNNRTRQPAFLHESWRQYYSRKSQDELAAECEGALLKLIDCLQYRRQNHRPADRQSIIGGRPTQQATQEEWSWTTGVILAFTIVTTIGYGQVTPQTPAGRMFCIVYGIFGIPLVLLALANQGRFFSAWLLFSYKNCKRFIRWLRERPFFHRNSKPLKSSPNHLKKPALNGLSSGGPPSSDDSTSLASSEDNVEQTIPASVLLCIIFGYLALGGYLIGEWESEGRWSFIDSTYFVFTSAASIGFGDLVPSNRSRLALTFLYICFGLALTTTAIDIFAEYLRRLHYWGVKIKNVASTFVWFGGNKVTINQLVRTIGHELGASEDKIKTIVRHLDSVVSMAIQEADEQQEIVEDLQFVEPFIPATNERLLVHQNSFEFGIAEASLLSPLIFSPPDHQQQNVVIMNNNEKRKASFTSMESMKSFGDYLENGQKTSYVRVKRRSSGGSEAIQFIDSVSVSMPPMAQRITRSAASVHSGQYASTPKNDSPRELVTFVSE